MVDGALYCKKSKTLTALWIPRKLRLNFWLSPCKSLQISAEKELSDLVHFFDRQQLGQLRGRNFRHGLRASRDLPILRRYSDSSSSTLDE